MGIVYRATDPKLKRKIAIKVLPEAFAADADRLARFEREAQLLAQLQHKKGAHQCSVLDNGYLRFDRGIYYLLCYIAVGITH